jgi:phosphoribosylanthranilate isomerase
MSRTRIKICGVCRPEDARLAVAAGADAIGIIRVKVAGRYVDSDTVRAIAQALPAFVTPVLVYVDPQVEEVRQDQNEIRRATVQLNGNESPEFIRELGELSIIKAIRMDSEGASTLRTLRAAKLPNLVGVTLESPGQVGGSGVGNDWTLVRKLQADGAFEGLPIIAAGGVNPTNVAQVVRDVRPFGVDVSSGVEERKREKSERLIRGFVDAVRSADAS